jgi:hypothetical protein
MYFSFHRRGCESALTFIASLAASNLPCIARKSLSWSGKLNPARTTAVRTNWALSISRDFRSSSALRVASGCPAPSCRSAMSSPNSRNRAMASKISSLRTRAREDVSRRAHCSRSTTHRGKDSAAIGPSAFLMLRRTGSEVSMGMSPPRENYVQVLHLRIN